MKRRAARGPRGESEGPGCARASDRARGWSDSRLLHRPRAAPARPPRFFENSRLDLDNGAPRGRWVRPPPRPERKSSPATLNEFWADRRGCSGMT